MPPKKRFHEHLKDHFVPHEGNAYRPKILATEVVVGLLVIILLVEGVYVVGKQALFGSDAFLASVLPGVLISLTNDDRSANGEGELTENDLLTKAAQMKADDMAEKGYFAHVTPDGKQPWYWVQQAGYSYEYAGENLAVNFDDSKDVEEAWMNSPTHRANIVKPVYTEIGIATARGTYKGEEATFVVQFFASPKVAAAAPVVAEEPEPEASVASPEGQVSPVPAPIPAEPAEEVTVLGETAPTPAPSPLEKAAAAPTHTAAIALSILAGAVALLLVLAVISHMKAPYVEGLAGTFALLVLAVGLMAFNTLGTPLELPQDTQAASVRAAF